MPEADKPLVWLHGEVKTPPFSKEARVEAGVLLRRLQRGETLSLPASRPMPTIGRRCHELRIRDAQVTWRVIYRLDSDAIIIVEVFAKKTAATPKIVIESWEVMNKAKRARLEAKGWRIGSAADFLELTPEEAAFVETKLALTQTLRERRTAQHLTQHSLAKRLSSSQSRIAKMEAGDSSVSVDLLLRALFALGAKPRDIAMALQRRRRVAA